MAREKLTVVEIDSEKRFIRLSNGHKYLFGDDAAALISSWHPGVAVWIAEAEYPPSGYELRPVDDVAAVAVVIWVAT